MNRRSVGLCTPNVNGNECAGEAGMKLDRYKVLEKQVVVRARREDSGSSLRWERMRYEYKTESKPLQKKAGTFYSSM